MKNATILIFTFLMHQAFASEYVLNQSALHADARDFSLGGLICEYETVRNKEVNLTCLIPFQLYELSVRRIDFSLKSVGLYWKVGWYQSGNEDWMENNVGFQVGKMLNDRLYLGVNASMLLVDEVEEGVAVAYFAELESHYGVSEKVTLGIRMVNPAGSRIGWADENYPLSSSAHLGIRYAPTAKSRLYMEMEGQLQEPLRARIGLEHALHELFMVRAGLSAMPLMSSWGIGGCVRRFRYSWGGSLHPILGFSNGFTLTLNW